MFIPRVGTWKPRVMLDGKKIQPYRDERIPNCVIKNIRNTRDDISIWHDLFLPSRNYVIAPNDAADRKFTREKRTLELATRQRSRSY